MADGGSTPLAAPPPMRARIPCNSIIVHSPLTCFCRRLDKMIGQVFLTPTLNTLFTGQKLRIPGRDRWVFPTRAPRARSGWNETRFSNLPTPRHDPSGGPCPPHPNRGPDRTTICKAGLRGYPHGSRPPIRRCLGLGPDDPLRSACG